MARGREHAGAVLAEGEEALERAVRNTILRFVREGRTFKALDIADAIRPGMDTPELTGVVRAVRRLFDAGYLRPFGYRRTVAQDRTPEGVMTSVAYAPRASPRPRRKVGGSPVTAGGETAALNPESEHLSPARPFAYLGLGFRDAQRLERQTETLKKHMRVSGREIVRVGEQLLSVRALLGAAQAARYVEQELGVGRDTARRLMHVAEKLKGHPRLESLAAVRSSLLFKLTEPSFAAELREAILTRGGLTIDGTECPIESLRTQDLTIAKKQWMADLDERRRISRALAAIRGDAAEKENENEERLRARLSALSRRPPTDVTTPARESQQVEALQELVRGAEKLGSKSELIRESLPEDLRRHGIEALRKLLSRLEKG